MKFASVTEKELSNTKLVAGQVVPVNMETFYPDPTKGKVKEIFIKEGQEIAKGQKLFSYDNPELSIQLRQLEIDKKSAKMRSDQGNAKVASIKSEIQKGKGCKCRKRGR